MHPKVRWIGSTGPSQPPRVHVDCPAQDAGSAVQKGGGGPGPLLHEVSLYPPQQGVSRY